MPAHATSAYRTPSRRQFLSGLCAATGLATLPHAAAQTADLPPLACRLASYGKFQDTAWAHLPTLGIHHIFISVPAEGEIAATEDRLHEHGLTALVMRGAADLSKPSSTDELAAQLSTCKQMGVHYMFLSPKHGDAPKEAVYERLRQAGAIAQENGVVISLETHPDLGTNADVHLETMHAIDHPNVRVNFDTGNISFYNHGLNAAEQLAQVFDYVATVELKDHSGAFEAWEFPTLGTGKVDLAGAVNVLQARRYSGPVTLEFEGVKGIELNEADTKKAIEDSIAYIRSLGSFQ